MTNRMDYPAPLRHKLMLTVLLGIACFLIGFAVFLFWKDQTTLLLSLAVLTMSIGKGISFNRILSAGEYEVVECTCTAIWPNPIRKYQKIKILDSDGNECSLLLNKHSKIKVGSRYCFYFKETDRITLGSSFFDSAMNADCFLGFEELPAITEDTSGNEV